MAIGQILFVMVLKKQKILRRKLRSTQMAAQKKLEKGSQYAKYDVDGDGVVTDEELDMDERLMRLENEDKRQDAQRFMAWFALWGMLLYPSMVVISLLIGLDQAAKILGDMAAVYYVSVAAIVAAYFGTQALKKK
tara:strand:- start:148 stop:552 length:405 start_codon:yes stop_codon:yes gene_type:complete